MTLEEEQIAGKAGTENPKEKENPPASHLRWDSTGRVRTAPLTEGL